ncbi:MAG: DUF2281 domain-containing protein [bacterium]
MTTADKISRQVNQLPKPFQKEALHFIEFLTKKAQRENSRQDDLEWFNLSVTSAMRDLGDEDSPSYDESDLKEKWQ